MMFGQSLRDGTNANLGSPSTFMKLQNPDTTPDCWYDQEGVGLGVADMFNDHAL